MSNRLKPDTTLKNALITMAEGNPGGLSVMMKLLEKGDKGVFHICLLDSIGIYGSSIWIAYKDFCGENIDNLIEALTNGTARSWYETGKLND